MLHVLLTILAVLGRILLIMLCIILILLLCILFAPIRYKGNFLKDSTRMGGTVKVSWLIRAVYFRLNYADKKVNFELYLLGIPIFRLLDWIKKRRENKKAKKRRKKKKTGKTAGGKTNTGKSAQGKTVKSTGKARPEHASAEGEQSDPVPLIEMKTQAGQAEKISGSGKENCGSPAKAAEEKKQQDSGADQEKQIQIGQTDQNSPESDSEKQEQKKTRVSDRIRSITTGVTNLGGKATSGVKKAVSALRSVREKIKSIPQKLKNLSDKGNEILAKIRSVYELVTSDLFRKVFILVKKELIAVVKEILPRKIWGFVHFGMENPADTGEILGVLGCIYPVIPKKLKIIPDFENSVLEADVSLKGRIHIFILLFHGLKVLLNKKVRKLIRKIRHKEE